MKVVIKKSTRKDKKYMAIFSDEDFKKTVHFGSANYSDYTTHKDPERKKRYIARHKSNENWNDYMSAGSLSKNILCNKVSLKESITDYKKKFKLN